MVEDSSVSNREADRWDKAVGRQRVVRNLLGKAARSRADVDAAATQLGVHPATVYRLLAKYAVEETAQSLVNGVGGWRAGEPRLPAKVVDIIDVAITEIFLTRQAPSKAHLRREIARRCFAGGLAAPSASAIERRLQNIGARERAGRRHSRAAAEAVTMRPGSLTVTRPNAIWQIDHSPADVILVDAASRAPIGRPWVTMVIDVASRVITGLFISLDAPSVVSVGMALRHAILAKDEALAERGISADWPGFGLPELIHTDNGSDFRSRAFGRACANLGVEIDYRPGGAPRFGGHIERLIGSAMIEMHLLPGTTFSNVAKRGDYDSDAAAVMTIDEFETWLWRFVAADYNRREHSSLSAAPLDTWRRLCAEHGVAPRQPLDPDALSIAFLPRITRTITRQGIVLQYVRYFETFLEPLFDTGRRRVEVAYDPRDMSRLLIDTPQGARALRYRNLTNPPVSLWELRAVRNRLVAEGRATIDEVALFAAREANQALVAAAGTDTRRRRREAAKRDRHLAQSPVGAIAVAGEDPISDADPWTADEPEGEFSVEIEPW